MIVIERIDHINMRVHNLGDSIEFYKRLFGFEIKEDHRGDREPWVIVGVKGTAYLCMYEHPGKAIPYEGLTLNHFGFAISDFDGVVKKLQDESIEILYGGPIEWPHSRSVYIKDPSGHELELAEKVGGGLA